ncbi:protein of uncharacterised function DUF222 [Mycolicibacterium aurum]|uniref:Protein of uncharacterized function DUF222 n=1 Tax=Mycolicibacterium aurum TaxID=1791 RepID=A0A3S4VI33_MYCAU|nr:HNH endonuclease signature motif containing protein [Mycolicibacterium aurum]VEG51957.1 protein of uncharacterised function DUF222 [Mycolicibacterium aurum]
MFDTAYAGLDEAGLLAAIEQASQEEAAAGARKLAAIAELVYSTVDEDDERGDWAYDPWKNASALVGAALTVSQKRASGQMRIAVALRGRLPKIAALLCQGRLSPRLISEITWRTQLVADDVVAMVDAALADRAVTWGPLSDEKLVRSIEAVIDRYDPDAVRRAQEVIATRDLHIGAHDDPNELAAIWGKLLAGDAAVLKARVVAMVKALCDNDPRSAGERRSAAMGAIAHGNEHLACRCGSPGCTATGPAKSHVVISVLADPAAVEAAQELIAVQDREQAAKTAERSTSAITSNDESAEVEQEPAVPGTENAGREMPACLRDSGVALLPGAHVLPIVALAEAIRDGAAIKRLWLPGPDPEPHYRPSAKLAAFIRARDVFCRFPGCDVPAERCDIDHVVPYPYGPTHASNMNCKCRTHHVGKTFWEGWRDQQLPDGTVIWTDPTGRSYTTMPGSRLFFPSWNVTTAELPPMAAPPPDPDRLVKMPKRRRTRAAENAARITAEREANAIQREVEKRPANPGAEPPPDYGNDPPPF